MMEELKAEVSLGEIRMDKILITSWIRLEQPMVDVLEINTGNQIEMVWTPLEEEQ